MTYEAWRITYQDGEQAARAAFQQLCIIEAENKRLRDGLTEIAKNWRVPVDDWATQRARVVLEI